MSGFGNDRGMMTRIGNGGTKIRVLEPSVASQIAAGEVVERPASVVKELVDNSLDAGAREIRVLVARGGLEEIRILDDGEGMNRADLVLAPERHATSKIRRIGQLATLATLGFRGEALPSMAAVSRMTLESSPDDSGAGNRIRIEGGRAGPPEVVGHPRGTTVSVRDLFYNAPARRKFLRSPGTETGRIAEVISRIALAHFDRRFFLAADDRTVLDAAPAGDRRERVRQIFGDSTSRWLVPFALEAGCYRVSGFASRPDFTRSTTRDQWLYVNGRPVRDRGILHAITGAYHTLLARGRHPLVLVFLEVPPDRVDFNVHPAKLEVRLADPRAAHEAVRVAIQTAWRERRPVPGLHGFAPVSGSTEEWRFDTPRPSREAEAGDSPGPGSTAGGAVSPTLFEPSGPEGLGGLVPLAQYRDSYILASAVDGLVIVDQHAAHERILYEELLRDAGREQVEKQALLFPVTVELGPAQARRLEEGKEELERLGFSVEPFGDRSLLVREVPALLGPADVATLLRDLADDFERSASATEGSGRMWDRLAATTACHAAVKVNFPLTREKMTFLLDSLTQAVSPMTCPHGRPVVLRLTHRNLEKEFRRR